MKQFLQSSALALTLGLGAISTAVSAQQMPNIEAEQTAMFGSAPAFTSADPLTSYAFDTGYIGGLVNAPLQSVEMLHFNAPVEDVWEWVTSGNDEWTLVIETLTWDHSASATPDELGVGSVRRCDFKGGQGFAYERVLAVEENRLFAYDLDFERSNVPLPIRDFVVIWSLEEQSEGVLVTARIFYHEAQDMGGQAAKGVADALSNDFRNFANVFSGTYITM